MIVTIFKICSIILAAVILLVGCQTFRNSGVVTLPAAAPDTLRIATYNVHYIILERDTGPWSTGDWERRKTPLDLAFKDINADVIGFQEMESFGRSSDGNTNLAREWLLENNPDYAAAATGEASVFPPTQPIFYRTDRLALRDEGWFFFSDTPDVIYSRTFNGSWPAFTSWAEFQDKRTNEIFKVFNIHTDYASRDNRLRSVALVADRISPAIASDETVFVIGDLNARIGDAVVDVLAETGLTFAPVRGATVHFNRGINLFGAIDHIATSGAATLVGEPVVLRQKYAGEWPTDHYPVVADYTLGAP